MGALSLALFSLLFIPNFAGANDEAAYNYLNQIRRQAGLQAFQRNKFLERAANNHVLFLDHNQVVGQL